MEVSCFEKFEIRSKLSSWRRFEKFPIMYHLQRPNYVLAGKSPKYTLKTSTLGIQNTRKYRLPTWGRPMEVSCFGIFEIQSELSSRQRFEN